MDDYIRRKREKKMAPFTFPIKGKNVRWLSISPTTTQSDKEFVQRLADKFGEGPFRIRDIRQPTDGPVEGDDRWQIVLVKDEGIVTRNGEPLEFSWYWLE